MTFDPTTAQPETPAFDPNTAMPDGTPTARAVVRQAVQVKPDTAAEVARLAKRYPAPYETIERNVDDFRLFDAADGIAEQLAGAPPVEGAFRANARLAAMAHDDVPTLTKLSAAMSDAARYIVSAPGTKRGLAGDALDAAKTVGLGATVGVGKAIFDVTAVVYDALGADSWAEDMRVRARRAGEAMDYFGMDAEGSTAKGVKAGLQSAGTNLAMLPIGLERALFSTAQSAATAVAAAMGTSVGAAAYNEARDKGKDKVQAAIYGIPQGTFEFVFERMPAAKLFGDLASNASLMQTLRNQALTEGWTEQLTTLAQDFNEWMNMNPEKTLGEFIAERPDAAYQTFIATLVGVGVQTTTIKAIDKVVEKASDQRLQFQQDAFNDFLKMAGQSALRERSPEQFREVVQRVVEANPQGMQSIHVDAQVLNQLPEELLNQLPESVRAQIPDAALANGTVEIPMADVLTIAPGTPMEQVLNDHARMTPDAMSRADAQAAGDQAEVLKQEAARIVQQAQDQQAAQADYDQVQQLYAQQLADTGRVRPAVADMQAHWIASFYTAYGSRMGLTASQFQQRYPIRVLGAPSASTGPVMDQGKPGEITVEGYHFSTEDRPTITTAAYGTGLRGSGREMYQGAQDQRLRKRTYFYADKGTGIRPESGVGGRAHRVNLTNVYDSNADPLGLKQGGGGQLGFESRVLDAGFSGYLDRLEGTQPGQVIMLGDQTGKRVPAMPKTEPTWENYATGAPEQMQAQMERLQAKPAWGAYDFRVEGNALQYRKREGVYQQSRVKDMTPAVRKLLKNLTPIEQRKVTDSTAAKIIAQLKKLPPAKEMAAVALGGQAKRGWYRQSAEAISAVFQQDGPRFAALLAATSPQCSVEVNLLNALNIWKNWTAAGRPTEREAIIDVMGASVQGGRGRDSVLDAWINNSVRALTADNPADAETSRVFLSGPKVNSFFLNLIGVTDEVTNDAWMANYALVDQVMFSGSMNVLKTDPGKGSGYLAMAARTREAAAYLTKVTGETWTPAEVQETVWSWAKTLYEMQVGDMTATRALNEGLLTDDLINSTPDFSSLFNDPTYGAILKEAGYGDRLDTLGSGSERTADAVADEGSDAGAEADAFAAEDQRRLQLQAARRLERLREQRNAGVLEQSGDLNGQAGNRAGRYSSGSLAPLEGAPTVAGAAGPDPRLVAVAEQYARENGIDLRRQASYVQVDPERAARIAAAYEAMEHAPNDPAVREAYDNLAQQTLAQYLALQKAGYQFYLVDETNDPYAGNPWNAMRDLRANQTMGVFATEAGFGTSEFDPEGNPLLADTGLEWGYGSPDGPKKRVLFNDLFRAVHDAFGHGLEGAGFRAQGEENAWQAHVRLFTGSAVGAITSETRGQNSWLNYGPHGQANQTAKVEDTIFADQKTGLMPEWTWTEGRVEDEQQVLEQGVDQTKTPEFKAWFGDSKVVDAEGRPLVVYHGTEKNFNIPDPARNKDDFGFFTTPNPKAAESYAFNGPSRGAGYVMPLYLSIKNPYTMDNDERVMLQMDPTSYYEGGVQEFIASVKASGYDGILIEGKKSATGEVDKTDEEYEDVWVALYPEQIKSAIGNDGSFDANDPSILSQGPRGTFNPRTLELVLNPNANLSTWFHETGHFFLEVMADIASQPGAPAQIVDDFNTFLKWAGVKDAATWNAMDLDGKRAYHERWAESIEQYVMEGKVPNKELQPLMRRFAAWLKSVYGSIQKMLQMRGAEDAPAQLNDDIRRVMDRLVATDEQIAQANEVAGLMPDPTADAEAAERLAKRSTADLKWAVRARDQVIAKLRKQAAAIEKDLREQVTVEVDQMPEMRAKAALDALKVAPEYAAMLAEHKAARKAAEAQVTAEVRAALLAENPDAKGLVKGQLLMKNKRDIANKVDAAMIKWDTANPAPKRPVNATDADVATIADSFGFESVDAMMQAIDAFGSRKDAIDGLTQQRMLEEHGDLVDERALADAANEAVHNEARARSLATELRTQREMLNPRTDTGETNARGAKITTNALLDAAKQFAANVVGRTPLADLTNRAWQHTAAERRAGQRWQQATAAGKTQEAVQAKQDQMLNHAAAKAAIDAKAEMGKILEFFKRVVKGNDEKVVEKGRDPDIVNAARAVLRAYGIETGTTKTAEAYLETLQRNDPDTHAVVAPMVAAATQNAQPIQALTFDELLALHEEVQAMWHLAKRSRQMEVDGDLLDIQDAADELHARLEAIGIPDEIPGETGALTKKDERARWLQFAGALLRRVEQWSEGMDGKYGGPFLRYVFQPIKDAADRYRTDRLEYRKKFQALVDNVAPLMTHQLIAAPELGYTFGKGHNGIGHAELLHAILHTGNESNKRKLLLGRQWATENPDGTLDTSKWGAFVARLANTGVLQQAHFDFAQGVWDLMEETKPLAQKAHRDVFGRYFAEVTADSFVDPFGVTRRGGYVPAQADPAIVQDASIRALAESENENMAYSFPTTSKGFTKGRVEYNRPLKLDLRTIPQHLDKVLLFSHMEPAVRGVSKLLRQKTVSQPLGRIDPSAYDGMLLPWLNRSARQIVETPILGDGRTSRVLSALRSRAGAALMFANISNAVQQITGFSTAAVKVKPAHLMRGAAAMIAHPKQTREAVANASDYMATRMTNEVAAMTDAMNEILLNPSLYERAQAWSTRHSYFLQSALDNAMSPMIWTGAYNQALEEGMDERMAVRFADGVVRQTQGANAAEDVSRIETGPAYARIFTQFIGYFNMLANTNGTALKQIAGDMGLKKGAGKALGVVFYGMLAPIWVAEAIAQAFRGGPDDEDKDGYLDDWLAAVFGMGTIKGMLAQVPFVAQVGQVVVNRFNTNPADDRFSLSPAVSLLESAASVPHDVYKGITGEGNAQRTVRDAAALVSLATGLPATAVARPVGYLAGVAQGKVEPTGPVDMARGVVTGTASPESKQR